MKFLCFSLLFTLYSCILGEEEAYYYYYYGGSDSESAEVSSSKQGSVAVEADPMETAAPAKFGYFPNLRMKKTEDGLPLLGRGSLVNQRYIDKVATEFECLFREEIISKRDLLSTAEIKELEDKKHGVDNKPDKKLSFRERQQEKMQEREKAEQKKELKEKTLLQMGSSCEDRVCYSCRAIMNTIGTVLLAEMQNPKISYVMDVLEDDFCNKYIMSKFKPIVGHVCIGLIKNNTDYRDFLGAVFEMNSQSKSSLIDTVYWKHFQQNIHAHIFEKSKFACVGVGACSRSDFEVTLTPSYRQQEYWNENCYLCNAVMQDVENRISIMGGVSEAIAKQVMLQSCNFMGLIPGVNITGSNPAYVAAHAELSRYCQGMLNPDTLDENAWVVKVHAENVERKSKSDVRFSEKSCIDMKICEKWISPEEFKRKEVEKLVEAVYE